MNNNQHGSALLGQLALTSCQLLLVTLIYLWMIYHQKLMQGRLQQLRCLKQKTDAIENVVKKINGLNRSIAAIRAATVISPSMAKSISLLQGLQSLIWTKFTLGTFTYTHCPKILGKFTTSELPYTSSQFKLSRDLTGMAIARKKLQLLLPLNMFGPVPAWFNNNLFISGNIPNQFSLSLSWSIP